MSNEYNEFAKQHGAKKEVYDEDLKFRYKNKSMREYTASIYGLPFQDFPPTAFTSEAIYQQWCVQVAGMMHQPDRGRGKFKPFMVERLAEAVEEEILPNTEEGIEVGVVVLTLLKNAVRNCRNFDIPDASDEAGSDGLNPGEWIFLETSAESKCGVEVYIKYEGLKAKIVDQVAMGATETKMTRKDVIKWLVAHGRHCGRDASVNRHRCAYVLPYSLVEGFEVFSLRSSSMYPNTQSK